MDNIKNSDPKKKLLDNENEENDMDNLENP